MADNDNKNIVEPEILNEEPEVRGIEKSTVERVMEDSFLKYSMSVIIDRALPDVREERANHSYSSHTKYDD